MKRSCGNCGHKQSTHDHMGSECFSAIGDRLCICLTYRERPSRGKCGKCDDKGEYQGMSGKVRKCKCSR